MGDDDDDDDTDNDDDDDDVGGGDSKEDDKYREEIVVMGVVIEGGETLEVHVIDGVLTNTRSRGMPCLVNKETHHDGGVGNGYIHVDAIPK